MILVTTGSSGGPFDRLLSVVERFKVNEEVVVQYGPSSLRPLGATCVAYLPFDELSGLVHRARVVVAHAGVGSILLCLSHGRVPFVVPRLPSLGEVVDGHQLDLARRLALSGAVTCVENVADLPELVRQDSSAGVTDPRAGGSALASELRRYIDSFASRRPGAAQPGTVERA
jgi:UDP-N-acetylglucosamine transferase subunit ALG13